jgi:8-oxo-(d)GTP phosphatase
MAGPERMAAGGVVLRRDPSGDARSDAAAEVLLVHRAAYDDWSLPKGHVDPGESDVDAALREVLEETGVHAEIVEDLGETQHAIPSGTKRVHWFCMRSVGGDPAERSPDDEVDVARWLPVTEALQRLTYVNERALLSRVVGATPTPVVDAARVRYRREVSAEHIGSRVSIRSLIDGDDGPQVTDRVGRLLSHEEDGILIVDRARTLHVIDPLTVLASRLVPEHPRLAAEPFGDSPERAIERDAARVLLLDPSDRTLLVAHRPRDGRTVWTAPGGGLDPGESHLDAARRELHEEIGIAPEIGPWIWSREATFQFRGVWLHQTERWFLARIDDRTPVDPATVPLPDLATSGVRWWTLDALRTIDPMAEHETVAPRALADHLARLLVTGAPDEPLSITD